MTVDLDALEAAAKAATPGPWEAQRYCPADGSEAWRIFLRGHENPRTNSRDCYWSEADAKHIAAASPTVVLKLVARVREAERRDEDDWHVLLDDVDGIKAERDAEKARADKAEADLKQAGINYLVVADAIAASSHGPHDLAEKVRGHRKQAEAEKARADALEAQAAVMRQALEEIHVDGSCPKCPGGPNPCAALAGDAGSLLSERMQLLADVARAAFLYRAVPLNEGDLAQDAYDDLCRALDALGGGR